MGLSDWTDKLKNVFHREAAATDAPAAGLSPDERGTLMSSNTVHPLRDFVNTVVKFSNPYRTSDEKWNGAKRLGGVLGLMGAEVLLSLQMNELWKNGVDALVKGDTTEVFIQGAIFAALAFGLYKIKPEVEYKSTALRIHWRDWETKQALNENNPNAYMGNDNFYHLKTMPRSEEYLKDGLDAHDDKTLKNINQRIGEDIKAAVDKTTWMGLGLIRAVAEIALFSNQLMNINGGGLIAIAAVGYALCGAKVMHRTTAPMKKLTDRHQGYEADFREAIMDVSENAEQIALLGGGGVNADGLREKFIRAIDNSWKLAEQHKNFTKVKTIYDEVSKFVPFIISAPFVLDRSMSVGEMFQAKDAFTHVLGSLNWVVDGQPFLKEVEATTNRVNELRDMCAASKTVHPQQNAPAA